MASPAFFYQDPLPLGPDETKYRLLTYEGVTTTTFEGREILKVAPETLAYLAQQAFHDTSFFLRSKHVAQVAAILEDPAASPNDLLASSASPDTNSRSLHGVLFHTKYD